MHLPPVPKEKIADAILETLPRQPGVDAGDLLARYAAAQSLISDEMGAFLREHISRDPSRSWMLELLDKPPTTPRPRWQVRYARPVHGPMEVALEADRQGDYAAARAACSEVDRNDPQYASSRNLIGLTLHHEARELRAAGDTDGADRLERRALDAYTSAYRDGRDYFAPLYNRACSLLALGHTDAAVASLHNALSLAHRTCDGPLDPVVKLIGEQLATDDDLAALRKDKRFGVLRARWQAVAADPSLEPQSFRQMLDRDVAAAQLLDEIPQLAAQSPDVVKEIAEKILRGAPGGGGQHHARSAIGLRVMFAPNAEGWWIGFINSDSALAGQVQFLDARKLRHGVDALSPAKRPRRTGGWDG